MFGHAAHKFWMKFSGVALIGFGIMGFFGTMPATNEPLRWGLDLLSWPLDGFPSYESREIWFLSALSGGFLTGWGVTMYCVSLWLYDLDGARCRKTVFAGLLGWFLVDSSGSITSGNWENAVWNILVLVILVGPMWRPAQSTA